MRFSANIPGWGAVCQHHTPALQPTANAAAVDRGRDPGGGGEGAARRIGAIRRPESQFGRHSFQTDRVDLAVIGLDPCAGAFNVAAAADPADPDRLAEKGYDRRVFTLSQMKDDNRFHALVLIWTNAGEYRKEFTAVDPSSFYFNTRFPYPFSFNKAG
jgi:hypothetical protein